MASNLAAGVTAFTSNAFLVPGDHTVLVDTGANFDIVSLLQERGDLDAVVLTHTHPDHVANLDTVKSAFGVDAWGYDVEQDGIDYAIGDGEFVQLGDHEYRALHTPGHKNDHICLFSRESEVLFAGDLVFANGGFGRTDLEEGDRELLVQSIEYVLDTIDENATEMHTGHGPSVMDPRADIELALQGARFG